MRSQIKYVFAINYLNQYQQLTKFQVQIENYHFIPLNNLRLYLNNNVTTFSNVCKNIIILILYVQAFENEKKNKKKRQTINKI